MVSGMLVGHKGTQIKWKSRGKRIENKRERNGISNSQSTDERRNGDRRGVRLRDIKYYKKKKKNQSRESSINRWPKMDKLLTRILIFFFSLFFFLLFSWYCVRLCKIRFPSNFQFSKMISRCREHEIYQQKKWFYRFVFYDCLNAHFSKQQQKKKKHKIKNSCLGIFQKILFHP